MTTSTQQNNGNVLLLTSVFGPFGVDDEYGEASNRMELFHNQVTREQGVFSYRFNHNSFGLYFLAENVRVPSTVLDFPSLDQFTEEIKKGYDYVGISFIVPNFAKAKKMTELIRQHAPNTKIILGGHGVSVPDLAQHISYDHSCRGDGIGFMRELFNEDPHEPVRHPLVPGSSAKQIMGVDLPLNTGIVVPGVGCANKCRFCATSHFFCEYTAFLPTGQDIFDVCCRYEDERGVTDFSIMDENFLKMKDRALELIALMEKHKRYFTFSIFSSAETLRELGELDLLIRLGVQFIWIGIESKKEVYLKNKGTDFTELFAQLKRRGIPVLASAILFLEHHDKETIHEDIEFAVSLKPDYLQFMELGPMPGTALHDDYRDKNLLLEDVPFKEQHGQDKIWFRHEHFTRDETAHYLRYAFKTDYKRNGASLMRIIETGLMGYEYTLYHADPLVRARAASYKPQAEKSRNMLYAASLLKENETTGEIITRVKPMFRRLFGPVTMKTRLLSTMVVGLALKEKALMKFTKNTKQPKMHRQLFNQGAEIQVPLVVEEPVTASRELSTPKVATAMEATN
ncbi:radical SAM protein [Myxococcota bacterium]|nr:radical SAM protein [Myxococcota bacterium]MBU1534864.1 radical SAM protein [Myxococcota bacterium]